MPEIILTEEQARVIREAKDDIVITDAAGTVRIVSERFDAIALANQQRRKDSGEESPGMSREKFDEFMKLLAAERARLGTIEPARVKEMLEEFRAREAV